MALKKYTSPNITGKFIQFVGGLNSTGGPLSLTEQESSKLQNIDFDKFGSVVKRSGHLNTNSSILGLGGIDSFTTLMLHMDGANGSTSFIDSSPSAHTIVRSAYNGGNLPVISTTKSKFGGTSGLLDGDNVSPFLGGKQSFLLIADSDDFDFSGGVWTVDFWVNFNALAIQQGIFSHGLHASNAMIAEAGSDGKIYFSGNSISLATSISLSAGVWNHVAIVENGNDFYIFINGVQGEHQSTATRLPNYATDFLIGEYGGAAFTANLNGYIDEFRISKGVARWTSNFTPLSGPYSYGQTSDTRVTGLQDYELSSGSKYLVAVVGPTVYQWNSSSINGQPTDITGNITVTPENLISSAVFRDTCLFTNGVDPPFQWNGTGNCSLMTVPTDLTAAKFLAIFQNYTFFANVTVDGTDYRSRVQYSNINSISTWTDFDFVDVSRDDGQMITGIKVLGDKLVIFKDRTIWVAQFTGDADIPFQFSQTNASVGCVSHFSIQEVDNGLVFLSWDGLYFFDGFNAYKISDRLNFTFHDELATLQFPNAVSMYQHTKNRYWLGIASNGSSTNDTVITWTKANTTTQTDAFSVYKGLSSSAMQIVYPDGITEVPYFGDYSGYVYKADTGVDDYPLGIQTSIDAYYYTNWISFDDLCDQKGTLSTYIYYQNNTATLTFVYAYDLNDQDQNIQTFSMSTGGAIWDTATWDSDVWAGGSASLTRRDIDGRGRLIRFAFKNNNLSEAFRIDGIGTLTYLETNV